MLSPIELEHLLKFNSTDLVANRLGQLSRYQKQRLANEFGVQTVVGTIFGLFFAGVGVWLILREIQWIIGGVFVFLGLLLTVSLWLFSSVSVDDLHVQRVSGFLKKEIDDGSDSTSYYLIIGTVRLSVEKKLFDAFIEGDLYSFYYCQRQPFHWLREAPRLLAAEEAQEVPQEIKKHAAY